MATIEIAIGKSLYKIDCLDSEKEKLLELAKKLNERVNKVSFSLRNADEKTILVTTALMLEGELERKNKNVPEVKKNVKAQEDVNKINEEEVSKITEQDIYDAVSESMENVADYIEKLANKIKNY